MALRQQQHNSTTSSARQKMSQVNKMILDQMVSLSNDELSKKIDKEVSDNYMLEYYTPDGFDPRQRKKVETQYGNITISSHFNDRYQPEAIAASSQQTLSEVLNEQVMGRNIPPSIVPFVYYIIENLDNNGYLYIDLGVIAESYIYQNHSGFTIYQAIDNLQKALVEVRKLNPAGVGANSLFDCICLQLERHPEYPECELAINMLKSNGNLYKEFYLQKKRDVLDKIAADMNVTVERIQEALQTIKKCQPKPGASFSKQTSGKVEFAVDIDINDDLILSSTLANIPTVRVRNVKEINTTMKEMGATKEMRTLMKQQYLAANNFAAVIESRNMTLLHIVQFIVLKQKDFILSGDRSQLHPLKLEDIAKEVDVDISTVSRATNGRYIQTLDGPLPLKMFFVSSINGTAKDKVIQLIKKHIQEEDPKNPLSDYEISELLKDEHFFIERRTVSKYRKLLGLPTVRQRASMALQNKDNNDE